MRFPKLLPRLGNLLVLWVCLCHRSAMLLCSFQLIAIEELNKVREVRQSPVSSAGEERAALADLRSCANLLLKLVEV